MAGRMPLDVFIARYDFADFNRAAADATSGAAVKPVVLLPQRQRRRRFRRRVQGGDCQP
jgi:hypothetical protein